jgi:predicted lipoprotein with Yx(FWY)xxD motif
MTIRGAGRLLVRVGLPVAVVAVLAAACGGSSSGGQAAQVTSGSSQGAGAVTLATHKGPAGTYLTDAKGHALYMFALDTGGASMCTGDCAKQWPPLLGSAATTSGSAAGTASTISRADGTTQITYAGHPLYYYVGDKDASDTYGQGLDVNGGKWWLVDPQGAALTGAAPTTSSPSTQSGWS